MTYAEVKAYINEWIVTNGNRDITAVVLNPVLQAITDLIISVTGLLTDLNTTDRTNLVAAINEVNTALGDININGSQVYSGLDNPNVTPPPEFKAGDFYLQKDILNDPIALFIFDGFVWQNVTASFSLDITGLIVEGDNITITGSGTLLDPYVINVSGGLTTPNLQEVTDVGNVVIDGSGNTTTIYGGGIDINGSTNKQTSITDGVVSVVDADTGDGTEITHNGGLSLNQNGISKVSSLKASNITDDRLNEMPDANGTLVVSVNGEVADSEGNIVISAGSTNLSNTPSPTKITLHSSTETDSGTDLPLADGTNAGLMPPIKSKVYTALISQSGSSDPQTMTSGTLTVGVTYQITDYISGDDFTNCGAPSNANGVFFVATNDTPTVWSNSSELSYDNGAPVVKVLENTIGNIWFTYTDVGSYIICSDGLFSTNTINNLDQTMNICKITDIVYFSYINVSSSDSLEFATIDNSLTQQDGLLFEKVLKIETYD